MGHKINNILLWILFIVDIIYCGYYLLWILFIVDIIYCGYYLLWILFRFDRPSIGIMRRNR